ncbi:hypothetical protein [Microbacterium sp.]|uniref:hypothetical protein n=1 Tax=Microbacterium sp. TaxID=51671 RepID=UPI0027362E5B|nr:hypothetical protein [Microbacterium sp.]MDP3950496.1 hypothetical protein [Microbacterium sp.]
MPEANASSASSPLPAISRRTALAAAAWSVPIVAAAVAVPAHAASGDTIDATGVTLTFTGPQWSSEFRLSGQLTLSSPATAATTVTATVTWQGTGSNTGAEGLYLYKGNIPGGDAGIVGWTTVQGAADDQLHTTFAFQTSPGAGTTQVLTTSSYDGETMNGFMYGAETQIGASTFWDGTITIRFSSPGYTDAVLVVPYVQMI